MHQSNIFFSAGEHFQRTFSIIPVRNLPSNPYLFLIAWQVVIWMATIVAIACGGNISFVAISITEQVFICTYSDWKKIQPIRKLS